MAQQSDDDFTFPIPLAVLFIAGVTLTLILIFIHSINQLSRPASERVIKESAWITCVLYVEERLQVPRNNIEKYSLDDVTKLAEKDHWEVEINNIDGHIYQCDLAKRTDGKWFLKSLYVR